MMQPDGSRMDYEMAVTGRTPYVLYALDRGNAERVDNFGGMRSWNETGVWRSCQTPVPSSVSR